LIKIQIVASRNITVGLIMILLIFP